jgi:hypothetical protein
MTMMLPLSVSNMSFRAAPSINTAAAMGISNQNREARSGAVKGLGVKIFLFLIKQAGKFLGIFKASRNIKVWRRGPFRSTYYSITVSPKWGIVLSYVCFFRHTGTLLRSNIQWLGFCIYSIKINNLTNDLLFIFRAAGSCNRDSYSQIKYEVSLRP